MRALRPIALVMLGVVLLQGCLFIPTFDRVKSGENVAKKVGAQKSRKPIRVNVSSRDDVLGLFGPPPYVSADGRTAIYQWTVLQAIAIWPLCGFIEEITDKRMLVLRFDERGILRSYRVGKSNIAPRGMQQWGLQRWPDEPERTVTTAPAN